VSTRIDSIFDVLVEVWDPAMGGMAAADARRAADAVGLPRAMSSLRQWRRRHRRVLAESVTVQRLLAVVSPATA
jgi:hypothetical protein